MGILLLIPLVLIMYALFAIRGIFLMRKAFARGLALCLVSAAFVAATLYAANGQEDSVMYIVRVPLLFVMFPLILATERLYQGISPEFAFALGAVVTVVWASALLLGYRYLTAPLRERVVGGASS